MFALIKNYESCYYSEVLKGESMAKYVNLNAGAAAGDGTLNTPFNISQFITDGGLTGTVVSPQTYYLRGKGSTNVVFDCKTRHKFLPWGSTSWGIKFTQDTRFTCAEKISNGRLTSASWIAFSDGDQTQGIAYGGMEIDSCFIVTDSNTIYIGQTSASANVHFKGCTLNVGSTQIYGNSTTHTFDDCVAIIGYMRGHTSYPNSVVTLTDCVVKTNNIEAPHYVLTNCQTVWTVPPTMPSYASWDTDTKASYDDSVLSVGIDTPHPNPGVGAPSYTGYETSLWGAHRYGIGATDSISYYCDLSLTDGGHAGTSGSPWSPSDLQTNFFDAEISATVYLKGKMTSGTVGYNKQSTAVISLLCWDTSVDGNGVDAPWQMDTGTKGLGCAEGSVIEGGTFSYNSIYSPAGTAINSCYIDAASNTYKLTGKGASDATAIYNGCVIVADVIDTTSYGTVPAGGMINDSILILNSFIAAAQHTSFHNVACNQNAQGSFDWYNCQNNWANPAILPRKDLPINISST